MPLDHLPQRQMVEWHILVIETNKSVDALAGWRDGLRSVEDEPVDVGPHHKDQVAPVVAVGDEIWSGIVHQNLEN
jgi:hypothetical protein